MLFAFGADGSADVSVTVVPTMLATPRLCTVPSDRITESVPPDGDRSVALSTVIVVVVAVAIRPPRRAPARIGSEMLITWPGRTSTPASIEAVNVTTSDSYCSE